MRSINCTSSFWFIFSLLGALQRSNTWHSVRATWERVRPFPSPSHCTYFVRFTETLRSLVTRTKNKECPLESYWWECWEASREGKKKKKRPKQNHKITEPQNRRITSFMLFHYRNMRSLFSTTSAIQDSVEDVFLVTIMIYCWLFFDGYS